MNSTAISGIVRLEASKMRRKTPHDPPDRCWIIIRPSDPIATPSHSRKPTSQARKKWSRATTKPTAQTTRPAMPTCSARVRTPSRSRGRRVGRRRIHDQRASGAAPAAAGRSSSARRSAGTSSTPRVGQLQRADVGGDRPAVLRRHLRRIVLHGAEAVGHDVEEVARWRVAQALLLDTRAGRGSRAARPCRCRRRSCRGTARRTR